MNPSRVTQGAPRQRGRGQALGRAVIFGAGLAVALAVALGVASTALAARPGDPLKLGKTNVINRLTTLTGNAASALLRIANEGTGPALELRAQDGSPPLTVNSAAKVDNLNADQLDGKDAGDFLPSQIYVQTIEASGEE